MTANEIVVKMIFDRWNGSVKSFDELLSSLSDEQLESETAPGKNRGIYLLGHLIAVHDAMLILLGMGEKLYPELYEPFIVSADRATADIPSVKQLREFLAVQNDFMKKKFDETSVEEWFEPHTAVSREDFMKEPNRNKLNIILTRTTHLAYHTGQMILLRK